MNRLGLIGFPLEHSFSKRYFNDKFQRENINGYTYELFPLQHLKEYPELLNKHPDLAGLNVTIPYKESIIPFLDKLDIHAARIGAVNTIVLRHGQSIGYNTDWQGFQKSLSELSETSIHSALVLGTGGASKAIRYALDRMGIKYSLVSRKGNSDTMDYSSITPAIIEKHQLIINCTPLGTFPNTECYPLLPYEALGADHILYDLVYNPPVTTFMEKGVKVGCRTINGYEMLKEQAEESWQIWRS